MKVIRDEDKKSNKYIIKFVVEKGSRSKFVGDGMSLKRTTEDFNDIVVYMANGSKLRCANIEENKVRLLQLMTKQHESNKMRKDELHCDCSKNIAQSAIALIYGLIAVAVMVTDVPNPNHLLLANALGISIPTIMLACNVIKGVIAKKIYNKLKEIKKNDYLLENKEILNEVDLENENILEKVTNKDKSIITEIKKEKDIDNDKYYFDINSIDNLSLDTLKKIKDNIERENYLGLVPVQEERKDNATKGVAKLKK